MGFHPRSIRLGLLGCLVIAAGVATALWLRPDRTPTEVTLETPTPSGQASPRVPPAPATADPTEAANRLAETMRALSGTSTPDKARAELDGLRNYLSGLPPEIAAASIRSFLESRMDATTGLELRIGPDGFLKEAPSLRVFLLDYLAQVDGPAARMLAEEILSSKDSPDEWAVCLRNYALASTPAESRDYLRQKIAEMILYEPWRQDPTSGYLESFDVIVYTRDTDLVPVLTGLMQQTENRALAHAAYLALDRLLTQEPVAVLGQFLQDMNSMNGRESTRADYFARADARDPQQELLLENYLLNPQVSPQELQAFAEIYPNANVMVSYNLLTPTAMPDHDSLAARDQKALEVVDVWLGDPRFNDIQPQLKKIRSRLALFVSQAAGAGR